MPLRLALALLALVANPLFAAPRKEVVREQRSFTIDGEKQVWRLIWLGKPEDDGACGVTDLAVRPCHDLSYAEQGDLVLERQRRGKRPERMRLTPLFANRDCDIWGAPIKAILPRWPERADDNVAHPPAPATIRARPTVRILRLRDYNQDGIAGEFLLKMRSDACGVGGFVAIGVTRDTPRLHALATAERPRRPLVLTRPQWEALARNARSRRIVDGACGDHGSEGESAVALRTERGRIHATRIISTCPGEPEENLRTHYVTKVIAREVL